MAPFGEPVLARESITRANDLRNRASDHQRFYIMLSYDLLATGNLERAEQIGELWAQTYPRDASRFTPCFLSLDQPTPWQI